MDENNEICRRSSILKPRKSRNPLGVVEERVIMKDNDKENVPTTPKPRRVSFASNNQVKQFATDEEKNTIWDSTYEETADGSSESSAPTLNPLHSITTSSKINVIYDENNMEFTTPVCFVQDQVQERINFEETLDFTKPVASYLIQTKQVVTKSKEISSDETLDFTLPVGYNIIEVKKVDENNMIICNDEIITDSTLPNNLNLCVNKNEKSFIQSSTNMSFTQAIGSQIIEEVIREENQSKLAISRENLNQTTANMSFTQAVGGQSIEDGVNFEISLKNPLVGEENLSKSEFFREEFNRQESLNQNNTTSMSFTQAIGGQSTNFEISLQNPLIKEENQSKSELLRDDINKEKSLNQNNTNSMSFTQAVGGESTNFEISFKNPLIEGENQSKAELLRHDFNKEKSLNQNNTNSMSFTQAVGGESTNFEISFKNPLFEGENQSKSELLRHDFNKGKSLNPNNTNSMSFTQAVGGESTNFEISLKNPLIEGENQSKSELLRHDFNKEKSLNENNTNNMSLTQAIGGQTVDDEINFEISLKNPLTEKENQSKSEIFRETINKSKDFNQNSTNNMSLTQTIDGQSVEDEINFEISLKNRSLIEENQSESKSEFSRIAAGDLFPSFSKLKSMPLGEGLNPSEFEVSLSELKSVEQTQEPSFVDSILESSISTMNLDLTGKKKIEEKEKLNKKMRVLFDVENCQKKIKEIIKNPRNPNITSTGDKLKKVFDLNVNYLKKCKESREKQANNVSDQSFKSTISIDDDSQSEIESIETIIKSLAKDNKRFWKLLSIENEVYKFSTLYGSINFNVTLKRNSDQVEDLNVFDKIRDKAEKNAIYIQKVFLSKLSPNHLTAALGTKFDIRSLLDFVREKMLKQRDFLKNFEQLSREHKLIMDKNFRIRFNVFVPYRKIAWTFFIHMSENDFQPNKNVTFSSILPDINGNVNINEKKIEKIISTCPSGILFIKDFIDNVHLLIANLK